MNDDYGYQKTNRQKRLAPKGGLYYCDKCDRNHVSKGERCSLCGARPEQKSIKKDPT